jgi:hypothetical protein
MGSKQNDTRRRSLLLRASFIVLLAAITVLAVEIGSLLVLYVRNGRWISRHEIQQTLAVSEWAAASDEGIAARGESPDWARNYVLHPYLGFVHDRAVPLGALGRKFRVNEHGFAGPLHAGDRSADSVVIAITGGSVAAHLYLDSRKALRSELKKWPAFAEKKLRFVSLALGGMKQPQQLLALTYLMATGNRFDVVVNVDGFNEVVLPFADNRQLGVHLSYPRNWPALGAKAVDTDAAVLIGRIADRRRRLDERRAAFSRFPLRHMSFSLALWHNERMSIEAQLRALDGQLRERMKPGRALTSQETGPPSEPLSDAEFFRESVELWKRSSLEMWALSTGMGFEYLHVLQPNQYVPGAKFMTPEEKRRAVLGPEFVYRQCVEQAYPLLRSAGEDLKQLGVPFVDLTRVFSAERGIIYSDTCCHYNQRGYDLLARRIGCALGSGDPTASRCGAAEAE